MSGGRGSPSSAGGRSEMSSGRGSAVRNGNRIHVLLLESFLSPEERSILILAPRRVALGQSRRLRSLLAGLSGQSDLWPLIRVWVSWPS